MGDFPNPEEEFELMYADELELLREAEDDNIPPDHGKQVRRSIDFSSPAVKKTFSKLAPSPLNTPNQSNFEDTLEEIQPIISPEAPTTQVTTENNKKRMVEDLFGDVDDINFDDYELPSKKIKANPAEDPDLELIDKILEMRKLKQELNKPLIGFRKDFTTNAYNTKDNLSYNIPRWPFLPLTHDNGEKIYVRFHSEEYMEREIEVFTHDQEGLNELLGSTYKDTWEAARKILEAKLENENAQPAKTVDEKLSEDLQMLEENVTVGDDSQLWVDRYKPKCYIELLSDEATNRTILHWLKLWDKIVFNREVKTKAPEMQNSFNKKSGKFEFGSKWRKNPGLVLNTELDEHGRPFHKMALLCGPPGCGKTTLAHLIARQAGYRPVEVNASDDRSVEAFKTALENATFMKSVLDNEKRPNCLILDEIDGAPLPAIEFLIKFCSGAAITKARKGQKAKVHILKRPIICICNDPYAPALRPLKQVAFVVHFPPTQAHRLAQRLNEISSLQGLQVDLSALTALSEKTANDIRACLGVLYFFKAKGKQIRLADVLRINIGQKDMTKGFFQVLIELFKIKLPTHQRMGVDSNVDLKTDSESSMERARSARFKSVLELVASAGDYDRLTQGVFENFLDMKMKDSHMQSICEALNWFRLTDMINNIIMSTQNYVLMPYLPLAFVSWHFLFASIARQKVKFPTQAHEVFQKQTAANGIIIALERGLTAKIRPYCSRQSLILDILPMLPHIITPGLKSANIQLYTEKEKQELHSVVSVMADFNINFIQERTEEGSYSFNLEPDIQKIGFFESKVTRNLAYAMKQVISREVELEKIRRAEMKNTGPEKPNQETKKVAAKSVAAARAGAGTAEAMKQLPNHLQRLEPKMIKSLCPVIHKDFFGRVVKVDPNAATKNEGTRDIIAESEIFYHYQEGFNNAVRKNVRMRDLM